MTDYISDERIDEIALEHEWFDDDGWGDKDEIVSAIKQALQEAEPVIRADQMRKDADWLCQKGREGVVNGASLANQLRAISGQEG